MYGNKEFWLDLLVYPHGLFAVAVAGCMHVARVIGDDVRALAGKIILQFLHGALVAGNYRGRQNDSVCRLEADVLVRFIADARERGKFVSLCASRQNDELLLRVLHHVFHRDDRIVSVFDKAYFARNLYIRAHRTSVNDNLLAILLGKVHYAYQALKVRGEHCDNKATFAVLDYIFQRLIDG